MMAGSTTNWTATLVMSGNLSAAAPDHLRLGQTRCAPLPGNKRYHCIGVMRYCSSLPSG